MVLEQLWSRVLRYHYSCNYLPPPPPPQQQQHLHSSSFLHCHVLYPPLQNIKRHSFSLPPCNSRSRPFRGLPPLEESRGSCSYPTLHCKGSQPSLRVPTIESNTWIIDRAGLPDSCLKSSETIFATGPLGDGEFPSIGKRRIPANMGSFSCLIFSLYGYIA